MAARNVPERLVWAADTLAIDPGDHVLEIGCGRGAAVSLICERLTDGTITALDRSAIAIQAAEKANLDHVRSGKARFLHVDLAAADLDRTQFDKAFAINVNLFWVRDPARELAIIERVLTSEGALHLFYGYGKPSGGRSSGDVVDRLRARFAGTGYTVDDVVPPSPDTSHMLYVRARPRPT
jgi:ubiquinone/menaquinone biosynthesis C-methylase UbiE